MAKQRARVKGLAFDLDLYEPQIVARYEAGVCEMTFLPFMLPGVGYGDNWASPSIDRRKPELGYVYTNIRIILTALNRAMGEWGEDRLYEIVDALRGK